ncbi:MAG: 4-hydroxy-3-methylbut-2-enyl diphosphate reductase [Candidatus Neomarinimicrobiota bacterium]|nr:MAG: 4-hydroxy-3-methylbut-2-enyl diphosphate reductase [Candidatus Neomarinimicrobiota bacterium]
MKIEVAQHCGFCSGVKNAVQLAKNSLEKQKNIAVLGDLVHNKVVMDELKDNGLVFVDSLDKVGNMPLLLRAHGTDVNLIYAAKEMGLNIIDATCPLVREIHKHARELEEEGRQVIVIGDRGHDEVIGIVSRLHDPYIIESPDGVDSSKLKQRTGVVIQSTQRIENVQNILPLLLTKSCDCRIINTICEPTRRNQTEILSLAKNNDCVIVIGDPTSANSNRLFEVSRSLNEHTYMVASKEEINPIWFNDCTSLGITAGASTPGKLIEEIVAYINFSNGDNKK